MRRPTCGFSNRPTSPITLRNSSLARLPAGHLATLPAAMRHQGLVVPLCRLSALRIEGPMEGSMRRPIGTHALREPVIGSMAIMPPVPSSRVVRDAIWQQTGCPEKQVELSALLRRDWAMTGANPPPSLRRAVRRGTSRGRQCPRNQLALSSTASRTKQYEPESVSLSPIGLLPWPLKRWNRPIGL